MVPALLRGRVFRRYWGASAISMFGDQVSGVALPLAHGAMPLVLAMLFAAEFVSGFGLMVPTPLPRYRLPAVDGPARPRTG